MYYDLNIHPVLERLVNVFRQIRKIKDIDEEWENVTEDSYVVKTSTV